VSANGEVCGVGLDKMEFFLSLFSTLARSETVREEVLDYRWPATTRPDTIQSGPVLCLDHLLGLQCRPNPTQLYFFIFKLLVYIFTIYIFCTTQTNTLQWLEASMFLVTTIQILADMLHFFIISLGPWGDRRRPLGAWGGATKLPL
jgi:hypothetical protein